MIKTLVKESAAVRLALWLWEKLAIRESVVFRAVSGSRLIGFLIGRMHIVSAAVIGLLFVVPHNRFNNLYSLLAMLALTGLYCIGVLDGRLKAFAFHKVSAYTIVFGLLVVLGTAWTLSLSLRFLLFYLTAFLAVLLTRSVLLTRRSLILFISILLAAITVSGLYGLYQSYVGVEVTLWQVDTSLNPDMPGRVYSFFDNPNNFAEILVLTLPFYAALFFLAKGRMKYITAFCALPPALSLILTLSRSCWMAFGLSVIVFFYFTYRWMIPVLLAAAAASLPVLPDVIRQRLFSTFAGTDSSILYRSFIRDTLYPVLSGHWAFGMGLGSDTVREETIRFYAAHPELSIYTWKIAPHAHNIYLQLWAELGIIGAASFCGAIVMFFRRTAGRLFRTVSKNFLAAAGIAGIAGALVVGFVEYIWFYPRAMLMFWLVIGLTLTALRLEEFPVE